MVRLKQFTREALVCGNHVLSVLVLLSLSANCSPSKKKKADSPDTKATDPVPGPDDLAIGQKVDQDIPDEGFFANRTYATEKFSGTREEALGIAGTLQLDSSIDIIQADQGGSGLRLLDGTDFDNMASFTMVFDPSLSFIRPINTALCVLNKVDYRTIPLSSQTISAEIKNCLPRIADKGSKSGNPNSSGAGGTGASAGGSAGSGSESKKKDDKRANITWESFVNVDKQLIVTFSYTEKGLDEWMPDTYKTVTFVIKEGKSATNPFGNFLMLLSGNEGDKDGMEITKGEMIVDRVKSEAVEAGDALYKVRYIDADVMQGFYKRMTGLFLLGSGGVKSGKYLAEMEGYDQTGEPGGLYRVSFNKERLHREKKIDDAERFFGPGFDVEINTEPVIECFKNNEFDHNVFSYRAFDAQGKSLADNSGFGFTTGNTDAATQGWASYWGADAYSYDGMPVNLESGATIYKQSWDEFDEATGRPKLGDAYTLQIKPGKLHSRSKVPVDLAKIDGKNLDWAYQCDETGTTCANYRIAYSASDNVFYKTAIWKEDLAETSGEGGSWQEITKSVFTVDPNQELWLWSEVLGGQLIITNDGGLSAVMETTEIVTDANPMQFVCYNNCPKPGTTAADLAALNTNWSETNAAKVYYPEALDLADVKVYDFSDYTLSIGNQAIEISGTPTAGEFANIYIDSLIEKTAWDALVTAGTLSSPWDATAFASTVYSFEMGTDLYTKTVYLLDSNGDRVIFPKPAEIDYVLTAADERFGISERVGESFRLTIESGFLQMPMEPMGFVTDPITGEKWENWGPPFALKDGTLLTDLSGLQYKIKADFIESRMKIAEQADCAQLILPQNLLLPEKTILPSAAENFHHGDMGSETHVPTSADGFYPEDFDSGSYPEDLDSESYPGGYGASGT